MDKCNTGVAPMSIQKLTCSEVGALMRVGIIRKNLAPGESVK